MRRTLSPHPQSPCPALSRLDVYITRSAEGLLTLRYEVRSQIDDIDWPAPADPTRTDDLWRQTCFEVFIRRSDGLGYYEVNLSPSGQWAVYGFSGYRTGMETPQEAVAPKIETDKGLDVFRLTATVDLAPLPGLTSASQLQLGVSAVIRRRDGGVSYWALTHPPAKADFHHPDSFSLALDPLEIP
jgi:hypothetical protein